MLVTVHAFSSLRSGMTCAKHTNGSLLTFGKNENRSQAIR